MRWETFQRSERSLKRSNVCFQERNSLLEELLKRRDEDSYEATLDAQMFEAERVRLSLLEEKIKEVLEMLRSLNAMVRLWTPILLNQHITQLF